MGVWEAAGARREENRGNKARAVPDINTSPFCHKLQGNEKSGAAFKLRAVPRFPI